MPKLQVDTKTDINWVDDDGDTYDVISDDSENFVTISHDCGSIFLLRKDIPTLRRALGKVMKL